MTIHLKENEIGFDATKVGFPGLGSCMGVVLQTTHGLFGFHAYGNNNPKGASFDSFCRTHALYGSAVHLFGSSRWARRYDGRPSRFLAWVEEMTFVAGQLNYHGPVSGFDLSNRASGVPHDAAGGAFLLYKLDPTNSTVTIRYAQSQHVDHREVNDPATTVRVVRPDLSIAVPYKNKVVQKVKPKPGNTLSTAGDDGFYSFVVP